MEYYLHLIVLIVLYTMLSQSLNLSAGYTGLISLAHAGFYGIGAYTTAILSTQCGFSFWLNLPIAMIICGMIAFIVSFAALRTVEDYFIICTLGIQIIMFSVMNNWMDLTRGPLGIGNIPSIYLIGINLNNKVSYVIISGLFTLLIWFIIKNLSKSGFGKTLLAINQDEIYSKSIGKNVYQAKLISFVITASLAAIPGALYAHYVSYIDPTSFTINESIFILSIVIIGGLKNIFGSFLASAFLILLPEALRIIGIADNIAANLRQIIYGLILVILMMTRKNIIKSLFLRKQPKI